MTNLNVKMAMQKASIVPDVIPNFPAETLQVTYGENLKVDLGTILSPTQVKDIPTSISWTVEPDTFYTLCLTDPDAPSREKPSFREWHHWLVGNILGCDVQQGQTLSEYIGAGPPKGTGHHRYVFLVYKQKKRMQFSEKKLTKNSGKDRGKFSITRFATKYKMGDPIAGNFFQAEWDEYVPILYKQLNCC